LGSVGDVVGSSSTTGLAAEVFERLGLLSEAASAALVALTHVVVEPASSSSGSASSASIALGLRVGVLLFEFAFAVSENAIISNYTVTLVCKVSAHLGLVLRRVAIARAAKASLLMLKLGLELLLVVDERGVVAG